MITNLLFWMLLLAVMMLFIWLFIKAVHARNRLVKWGGLIVSGVLTLSLVLINGVIGIGLYKLYGPHLPLNMTVTVAKTSQQVARGEHIATIICIDCHSLNNRLPLSGGKDVGKESPVPIGSLISYNLTPGGPLKDWSEGDIFRAIRKGVDPDGHNLIAMSALPMRFMSDDDIKATIAYLRSQPSIPSTGKEGDEPNLLFAIFVGANLLPAPQPVMDVVTAPEKGDTPEYGQYIVSFTGCRDCHGLDLAGGKSGGLNPVGPSLRIVKAWAKDEFISTLRTGKTPQGNNLDLKRMKWDVYGQMDDEELGAVYAYLTSLPFAQK